MVASSYNASEQTEVISTIDPTSEAGSYGSSTIDDYSSHY